MALETLAKCKPDLQLLELYGLPLTEVAAADFGYRRLAAALASFECLSRMRDSVQRQ